jgi:hypothetical protein
MRRSLPVDAVPGRVEGHGRERGCLRDSFVRSWNTLLASIESKRKTMRAA